MRITIWLSILIFVSTIYWPQLFNYSGILACVLSILIFINWPKWRYLTILPATALYFSIYVLISLQGIFSISTESINAKNNTDMHKIVNETFESLLDAKKLHFLSNIQFDRDNIITVEVRSLINERNAGYFIASLTSINNIACIVCPLVEMRWFNPQVKIQAGQSHQFKVRLKALQGKGNPSSFDRQKWRYSDHIAYIATIREHLSVIDAAISVRADLYLKMLKVTDGMQNQGAILALVFADKSLMSIQDKLLIKQLGIAHLFAISGLHIGLLFIFVFAIMNVIAKKLLPVHLLGWKSWRWVSVVSFMICLGYGYISGFSLPTERALVMLFISLLMFNIKRQIGMLDLLVLCLWSLLLLDPLAILSGSLWLSFTAMSTIIFFIWAVKRADESFDQKFIDKQHIIDQGSSIKESIWFIKAATFVKWLVLMQVVLTLFMLPIQLNNFSAISLFSLLINLIAIPLFSWVVIPVTLLATLFLLLIEPIALSLLQMSNAVLTVLFSFVDDLTWGYVGLSDVEIQLLLSVLLFLVLLCLLHSIKRFSNMNSLAIYLTYTSFITFVIANVLEIEWKTRHSWQVEIFDVGQGLSVLIKSGGETLLYDTGPSYPPHYSVADAIIFPYLQSQGIKHLDYFFVSHSDNDHAGGAKSIEDSLSIGKAYAGEAALLDSKTVKYEQCIAGQTFKLGKLNVKVISPESVSKNNNNNSCVLRIGDGVNSVLLTGDISKSVEKRLVKRSVQIDRHILLTSDILIAPHHGSATSSSIPFIQQVSPRWVVFAAGYKNRWEFPKKRVKQRYQQQGIEQITTGDSGFIRFNVQNQHIEVKTYREDLAAYWYHQHLVF